MNNNSQTMDILPVLKYGNPLLRKKVKYITDFTELHHFVEQMFLTMHNEKGIGLAANQVGRSINLLVVDTRNIDDGNGEKYIFINSKIIKREGSTIMEEGCLSIPDIRAEIQRPEVIALQYQDFDQNIHQKSFSGITSRIIQHELDHLEGKYFVDYLSPSKRMLIHKRFLEISKNGRPSSEIIL
jgi:peptide deformylase